MRIDLEFLYNSNLQAYYSVLRNKLGGSKQALETEPYSDYEAVDASSLFGKFKAKLRKSQMRKSSRFQFTPTFTANVRGNLHNIWQSRCQFPQHFTGIFLTIFWHQKISNPKHSFAIFGTKILYKKCASKTLMKLSLGEGFMILFPFIVLIYKLLGVKCHLLDTFHLFYRSPESKSL